MWCIGEYGELLVSNDGMLDVEDPINVSSFIGCVPKFCSLRLRFQDNFDKIVAAGTGNRI